MFVRRALLSLAFIAAISALNLKIRTSSPPSGEKESMSSRMFILAGQSYEAECWPDTFEFEGIFANYSIQFLKDSAPFQPRAHWSENPLMGDDPRLISGNDLLVDEVTATGRYAIAQKEHTYKDGTRVPKFVLSIENAQPEDTARLQCSVMVEVPHPHYDPTDFFKQTTDDYGKPVIVIGDLSSMEMFNYEMNGKSNGHYGYDIMAKDTLTNGQYLELDEGDIPAIAFRFFFPSFYPAVRFLLKDDQDDLVDDVTNQFTRYYDFKKETTLDQGPLIRMQFMQDYINDVAEGAMHYKFNRSHDGLSLWCEAQVVSSSGIGFNPHAQYVTLKLKRSEEIAQENTQHLPKDNENKRPVGGSVDKVQHDGAVSSEADGVSYGEMSNSKKEAKITAENSASGLLASSLAILALALTLCSL
ncbi:hypothetical protein CAPTEDRAFT_185626 [Capitella teleta]|uniref:Uncharacterized protein n=1 Tax=Capitella teleta TaxID=283909 RepID=R7UC49_CAPTE|nr:hypothetical protein CAPTEDRAFT_185626 [Capitella teleta]|eukprot:ELU03564.1 hypothetical protein CAPTEDRAFT_185626 [Capitella teleta]